MTDYFCQMACAFSVTPAQAEQLDAAFAGSANDYRENNNYPACLVSIWPTADDFYRDLTGEPSNDQLVFGIDRGFYQDGNYHLNGDKVDVEFIAKIICTICKPIKPIVIEYALTASEPEPGCFGGGVCVIFTNSVVHSTTNRKAASIIVNHNLRKLSPSAKIMYDVYEKLKYFSGGERARATQELADAGYDTSTN